jgi:hypothetical protein
MPRGFAPEAIHCVVPDVIGPGSRVTAGVPSGDAGGRPGRCRYRQKMFACWYTEMPSLVIS